MGRTLRPAATAVFVIISCDLSNKALFGRSVVRAGLANPHQTFPAIYTRNAIECSAGRADMDHATDRPSRGAKAYKPVGTVGLFCSICLHSYQEPSRLRVSGLALSAQVKLLVPPTPLAPTYPQRDCWRGVVGEKQPARPGSRFVSFPPTSPSVFVSAGRQEARRQARHASGCARNGPGLRDERARLTAPLANSLADDERGPDLSAGPC